MKNLMTYVSPMKDFNNEHNMLAKLQIDNSLDLGWKKEDIILATNFSFEYRGIRSIPVPDHLYYEKDPASSKPLIVSYLLDLNMLESGHLYWLHDFDAFENYRIQENNLGLDGYDMGLTTYCYKGDWNGGVTFFKTTAMDIYNMLRDRMINRRKRRRADEKEMLNMTKYNLIAKERYKTMNPTYNVQYRDVHFSYIKSTKPLMILHFHPYWTPVQEPRLPDTLLNTFMYGKNVMKEPLMSERLIRMFNSYGIK